MTDQRLLDFCEAEHPRLVGVLRLYCGDEEMAADLAQETLIRVVTHWPRVSRLQSPGGWAYRVAINLANSWFRRRQTARRAKQRLGSELDWSYDSPDVALAVTVRAAVASLPARQREALVLHHFLGMDSAEISQLMGCSEQAVRNLTHRARERLRPMLAALQEVDDVT